MAILECHEVTGRTGEARVTTTRRYTRVFQVLTSGSTDGAQSVRDWPGQASPFILGIPDYGDTWESLATNEISILDEDLEAFCVEKRAEQHDDNNLSNWTVSCEYVGVEDPTFEPPKINLTGEKYQETSQFDYTPLTPLLVANSAGDPYEHGITRDRHRRIILIERSVLTYNPVADDAFIDTVNSDVFLADRYPPGFAVGTCKIDELDAEAVYYENYNPSNPLDQIHYYRQKVKISIDPNGWNAIYLDAGYHQLVLRPTLTGTNLTVDATTNTVVLPDGYTPQLGDIGHVLVITGGAGFTTGSYTITGVVTVAGVYKWSLSASPAAAGTASGTWSLAGLTSKPKIILEGGSTPSTPQLLNGAGMRAGPSATPQYKTFIRYSFADWTILNLDF